MRFQIRKKKKREEKNMKSAFPPERSWLFVRNSGASVASMKVRRVKV